VSDKAPGLVGFLPPPAEPAERCFSRTAVPSQCLRAFLHFAQAYRSRTARAKPMNTGFSEPYRGGNLPEVSLVWTSFPPVGDI